jgi:hypothetical protein
MRYGAGDTAMANDKSDWRNVDVSELDSGTRSLYDTMKASYRQYAMDKAAFEAAMQIIAGSELPNTLELKFGYMFGKLSVAIGPKREAKAKASTGDSGKTLADWLRDKAASGDRS